MIDLELKSVSKAYQIQAEDGAPRRGIIGKLLRTRARKQFWAVQDVSFQVPRGEALGIIGHNGAGKSTILKLLSSIATPTKGEIVINGRLSALLEVGSGFHPELTGRENTYLSGSILGMRRKEITAKLDSIVEFAGLREFIDTPVKRYSSGMYVRLGFSIAAHLEPEILLLDEVLAVGDLAFQEKCKQRIAELHKRGTTLVFISHDLTAVSKLCQRVILLEHGQITTEGAPDEVVRQYTSSTGFNQRPQVRGDRPAEVTDIRFFTGNGEPGASFHMGEPLTARVEYRVHQYVPDASLSLFFYAGDGTLAAQWTTGLNGSSVSMEKGYACIEFFCEELGLQPGVYQIDATMEKADTGQEFEYQSACASLHVTASKRIRGAFYMPHQWRQVPPQRNRTLNPR
jgi:ABC-type polysaccharide/polyol phosphate transport system ATPase subunit